MKPITYGELMAAAEQHVVAAVDGLHIANPEPARVSASVIGHARLMTAAATHTDFLAAEARLSLVGTMPQRNAISAFRAALAPWRHKAFGTAGTITDAWYAAAVRLGSAHDALATHIKPDHTPLTLSATLLAEPAEAQTALRRLVAIVDVATLAAPRLARQAHRARLDQTPELTLLESNTLKAGIAAAGLLDALAANQHSNHLAAVGPAAHLSLEPSISGSPLDTVAQAVDILGRHVIEQARRPSAHSVATLHLVTATGSSLLGHLELLATAIEGKVNPSGTAPLPTDAIVLKRPRSLAAGKTNTRHVSSPHTGTSTRHRNRANRPAHDGLVDTPRTTVAKYVRTRRGPAHNRE